MRTSLIAFLLLTLTFCGTKKDSDNSVDQVSQEASVDVCQRAFQRFKSIQKGSSEFINSSLSYKDYKDLWKKYPDLEKMYQDIEAGEFKDVLRCGGNIDYYGLVLVRLHKYEFEEKEEQEPSLEQLIPHDLEMEYNSIKSRVLQEGWIWDEIAYNDCEIETPTEQVYSFCGHSYTVPRAQEVMVYMVVKGESTPFRFLLIETDNGFKFIPEFFFTF